LVKHWEAKGHVVRFEPGCSEYLAQWSDIYYIDTWDNNIHYLYKLYHGDPDNNLPEDLRNIWDNTKKPRVVVRVLDWEVWIGFVRDQAIVDWVDDIIFIAPHIQERVASEVDLKGKDHLIRPGVNLEKFTLKRPGETDGFQLGMVLGDMWWPKNHMAGLDIFTTLYQDDNHWRLHIRGQHEGGGGGEYWKQMYEHYLDSRGIREAVTLYPRVEDMNEWYEKIDILLHPGMKEAFCYAVGEAAAKGLPAIVNNFYGSERIWPKSYKTHREAVNGIWVEHQMLGSEKSGNPRQRKWIQENYSLDQQTDAYDKLLNL
jgi:glycosyltransferase involved in cell wall biosynthesis